MGCDARGRVVWCRDCKTRSGAGVRAEGRTLIGEMRRGDSVADDLVVVFDSFTLCLEIRLVPYRLPPEGQWGKPSRDNSLMGVAQGRRFRGTFL
jgi:hypothetical protein